MAGIGEDSGANEAFRATPTTVNGTLFTRTVRPTVAGRNETFLPATVTQHETGAISGLIFLREKAATEKGRHARTSK